MFGPHCTAVHLHGDLFQLTSSSAVCEQCRMCTANASAVLFVVCIAIHVMDWQKGTLVRVVYTGAFLDPVDCVSQQQQQVAVTV